MTTELTGDQRKLDGIFELGRWAPRSDLTTPAAGDLEPAVRDAIYGHVTVQRTSRHSPTLPFPHIAMVPRLPEPAAGNQAETISGTRSCR